MNRAMNWLTASVVLLLLLAGGVDAGNPDADRARAATALDAFAGQLKAALVTTMSVVLQHSDIARVARAAPSRASYRQFAAFTSF